MEQDVTTMNAAATDSASREPDHLITATRFSAPDAFYEMLLNAHQGLTVEQSQALNARLILLLANHIGSMPVLREALDAARDA